MIGLECQNYIIYSDSVSLGAVWESIIVMQSRSLQDFSQKSREGGIGKGVLAQNCPKLTFQFAICNLRNDLLEKTPFSGFQDFMFSEHKM